MNSDAESVEEENVFYFEGDHLAMRGNRDYSNILRTIAVLEAQRIRVHQQLEELELAKWRYLDDPELLLKKLRNNEEVIAPNYMTIVELPEIGHYDTFPPEEIKVKEEEASGSSQAAQIVRGRLFDDSKPETFNQLWSCEEQRRLEQLLIEYPVEAVEMRRFAKIAKALGNRTPQQVASRVQKYFKKLHDAGMPIPGRIPKNRRNAHTKLKNLYRPTTFFPAHNVTVHMNEDDFQLSDLHGISSPSGAYSNGSGGAECADVSSISNKPEIKRRIIYMLEVIRDEKRAHCDGYNPDPLAAKCENCHAAPISAIRWRCNTCYCYVNQCSDCIVSQLVSQKFEHLAHDVVVEQDK